MNQLQLFAWLRRQAGRRPATPPAKWRARVQAPEWLEPRTVLSASGLLDMAGSEVPPGHVGPAAPSPSSPARGDMAILASHAANGPAPSGPILAPFAAVYSLTAPPGSVGDVFSPRPAPPPSSPEGHYHHPSPADILPSSSFTMIAAYVPSRTTPVFDAAFAAGVVASTARPVNFDSVLSSRPLDLSVQTATGTVLIPAFRVITDLGQYVVVNWASVNADRWTSNRPAPSPEPEPETNYGQPRPAPGNLLADELTVSFGHADSSLGGLAAASLPWGATSNPHDGRVDTSRLRLIDSDSNLANEPALGEASEQPSVDDGLVELDGSTGLRRIRKGTIRASVTQAPVSAQVVHLAELPWLRDTQSALRDLVQLAHDAVFAAQAAPESRAAQQPEDGMLELLAADVGTFSAASAVSAASAALPASAATVSLDAGLALFQAVEVAVADDAASSPAVSGGEIVAAQPTSAHVARTE